MIVNQKGVPAIVLEIHYESKTLVAYYYDATEGLFVGTFLELKDSDYDICVGSTIFLEGSTYYYYS